MPDDMSTYTDAGYRNRQEYLAALADDYGVSPEAIAVLADVLGDGEDFDALISELEDYADMEDYA